MARSNHDIPRVVGEGPSLNLFRRGRMTANVNEGLVDLAKAKRLRKVMERDASPLAEEGWTHLRKQIEFLELISRVHSSYRAALVMRLSTLHPSDEERAVGELEDAARRIDAETAHLKGNPEACQEFLDSQGPWDSDELRQLIKQTLDEMAGD